MEQDVKGIVFKGNSDGLVIVIPEEYGFKQAVSEIEGKVSSAARFFKGARIKVVYRGIDLSPSEEETIKNILDEKSGAIIESFGRDRDEEPKQKAAPQKPAPPRRLFFSGVDEGGCKFVRTTIRSGTRIEYDGNVVVLGDVNPGGEIVASGNVVVLGTLRGMVHAGADGNREAFIYALNLRPTQIRISEVIARMPEDEADDSSLRPVLATVRDNSIEVEQL
jgi:septum site-determining protein MinC